MLLQNLFLPLKLKAHMHPKCFALRARQIWISCDTKLLRPVSSSFFTTIGSCTYILIRLCKCVPCSTFYSFPVLFCTCSVYIYKISRYKLTSTRRDGGLFDLLECVQPIRSRVWTIERNKNKRPQWVLDEGGPLRWFPHNIRAIMAKIGKN